MAKAIIQGSGKRKPEYEAVVNPDFSESDSYKVYPDNGKTFSSVDVKKNDNLRPENIKKDVNISGVVGTFETTSFRPEESVTVIPDFSEDSRYVVKPSEGKVLSSVFINKDDNMIPGNILEGVTINGIVGSLNPDHAKPEEEKIVSLDFSEGNIQEVTPSDGKAISKITISKPETLISENILLGKEIAGISGSLKSPIVEENESEKNIKNSIQIYKEFEGSESVEVYTELPKNIYLERLVATESGTYVPLNSDGFSEVVVESNNGSEEIEEQFLNISENETGLTYSINSNSISESDTKVIYFERRRKNGIDSFLINDTR